MPTNAITPAPFVTSTYDEYPPEARDEGCRIKMRKPGGPEYELRAWEPAGTGHIAYVQHVQTEEDPDFSLIWAAIEGTTRPQ